MAERRRLRPEGDGADASQTVEIDDGANVAYSTVKKWDGKWERIKVYDLDAPGWIFKWLNPRNPAKARRRLGNLYWKCLKRYVMAVNLLFFGIVFMTIGLVCHGTCTESDRAWAFMFIGTLQLLPGAYASTILFKYVCCNPEYSWKMLPEPS